ncbi:MAG: 50S ribosomal protein L4 [Candidatus Neomarinimicrobiota bacterium]
MEFQVHKPTGKEAISIKVDNTVFGIKPHENVVHQAVVAELTNLRQGTHSSKSRGMVRGGGRKPFKQKGRGMARAGTIRSPLWRGGGVVFGPEPHDYKQNMPKKMKRLARKSILSSKAAKGQIVVVEEMIFTEPSTKEFVSLLKNLKLDDKKITILPAVHDENLYLSARNVPGLTMVEALKASAVDLLDNEVLLFDKAGIILVNEQLLDKKA